MAISRIYYCDAPVSADRPNPHGENRCPTHARTAGSGLPMGFLKVTGFGGPLHFCSWDCVLRYAAEQPPVERIDFRVEEEDSLS
jgi:hypothetical protein